MIISVLTLLLRLEILLNDIQSKTSKINIARYNGLWEE